MIRPHSESESRFHSFGFQYFCEYSRRIPRPRNIPCPYPSLSWTDCARRCRFQRSERLARGEHAAHGRSENDLLPRRFDLRCAEIQEYRRSDKSHAGQTMCHDQSPRYCPYLQFGLPGFLSEGRSQALRKRDIRFDTVPPESRTYHGLSLERGNLSLWCLT